MPGRKNKPVAIGPMRLHGVKFQVPAEQYSRNIGHAHGHARVSRIRRLDRVHRQGSHSARQPPMIGMFGFQFLQLHGHDNQLRFSGMSIQEAGRS